VSDVTNSEMHPFNIWELDNEQNKSSFEGNNIKLSGSIRLGSFFYLHTVKLRNINCDFKAPHVTCYALLADGVLNFSLENAVFKNSAQGLLFLSSMNAVLRDVSLINCIFTPIEFRNSFKALVSASWLLYILFFKVPYVIIREAMNLRLQIDLLR
jgi:hypothetical protein